MRKAHIYWNLAGLSLPLLIAVLTVPRLIENIGHERFGLLTLAWGLIGYAGAFDFGIGRASTQIIASSISNTSDADSRIADTLFTAVRITLIAGIVGSAIVLGLDIFGLTHLIKISQVSRAEITASVFVLALAVPLQSISSTYRGVNEAYLKFKGINLIKIFLGAATFGMPFLISGFSTELYYLIASLVGSRIISLYMYKKLAESCIKGYRGLNPSFSRATAATLFRYGGWLTVSGILNPMVGNTDRLLISAVISALAVSAYVIPYEMIVQSLILVGAITTVAFPYLSQLRSTQPNLVMSAFYKIMTLAVAMMFIVAGFLYLFGADILQLWLAEKSLPEHAEVVKILSLGLVPYTVGTVCISMLHAYGKTELTAKINILEFPLFIALIYLLISWYGVIGAAIAWTIRVTLDALIVFFFTRKLTEVRP